MEMRSNLIDEIRQLLEQERAGHQYESHDASAQISKLLPEFLLYVKELEEVLEFAHSKVELGAHSVLPT